MWLDFCQVWPTPSWGTAFLGLRAHQMVFGSRSTSQPAAHHDATTDPRAMQLLGGDFMFLRIVLCVVTTWEPKLCCGRPPPSGQRQGGVATALRHVLPGGGRSPPNLARSRRCCPASAKFAPQLAIRLAKSPEIGRTSDRVRPPKCGGTGSSFKVFRGPKRVRPATSVRSDQGSADFGLIWLGLSRNWCARPRRLDAKVALVSTTPWRFSRTAIAHARQWAPSGGSALGSLVDSGNSGGWRPEVRRESRSERSTMGAQGARLRQ